MTTEIKVPDIGDFDAVEVIEILVAVGDSVSAEQSLITVESDKASMEIPSSDSGVVKSIKVKLGDKIKEGAVILEVESSGSGEKPAAKTDDSKEQTDAKPAQQESKPAVPAAKSADKSSGKQLQPVMIPDIGDFDEVEVIELLVGVGDTIKADQSLITVESDKASMEIPSTTSGVVKEVKIKVGDHVSEGTEILVVETTGEQQEEAPAVAAVPAVEAEKPATSKQQPPAEEQSVDQSGDTAKSAQADGASSTAPQRTSPTAAFAAAEVPLRNLPHASPSVRKFARELGVDLANIKGTGRKNRITADDVRSFVKQAMSSGGAAAGGSKISGDGLSVLGWPKVDFAKFGEIETKPLSRIKKISGANLHRNWVMIPHVTNNDVADITALEKLRKQLNDENKKAGIKVTMLAFIIKAVVAALKKFPEFNASLDGDNLVYKHYFHIGFAADTPNGLVVPVIRDADTKGVFDIAKETAELAGLAREGKLSPAQMQGGCFSISSLGGIGGTDFTPIINAPEVAILGVSRSAMQPVWNGSEFVPKLMLPLSLSYDHRVIDGAAAARFNSYLSSLLADFRRIIL